MTSSTAHRAGIDPRVLAKIRGLELRARFIVEGFMSGLHRSPFRGFSVEFAEHRKYAQGDDLRHLDWRVLGRTDKHYVKQYEQETNLQLMFVVDSSASMDYRGDSAGLSKREYAAALAAALAWLALHQADAVGLVAGDAHIRRALRTTNNPGQWRSLVTELDHTPAHGETRLRRVLDELAEQLQRRHVVVLISDLLDEPADILAGLKHLRHRRHETLVFQILDPSEIDFPFTRPTQFEGLEETDRIRTEPRVVRARYRAEVQAFLADIRRGCRDQRVDHHLFRTDDPLDKALAAYLAGRAARLR